MCGRSRRLSTRNRHAVQLVHAMSTRHQSAHRAQFSDPVDRERSPARCLRLGRASRHSRSLRRSTTPLLPKLTLIVLTRRAPRSTALCATRRASCCAATYCLPTIRSFAPESGTSTIAASRCGHGRAPARQVGGEARMSEDLWTESSTDDLDVPASKHATPSARALHRLPIVVVKAGASDCAR